MPCRVRGKAGGRRRARWLPGCAVGVDCADMEILRQLSVRAPIRLRGVMFRELFQWLSNSLSGVSR